MTMLTPRILANLMDGTKCGAELVARRPGYRRLLFVKPRIFSFGLPFNAPKPPPQDFRIYVFEATPALIEEGQADERLCDDYEEILVERVEWLDNAIIQLAGGPVELARSYEVYYPRHTEGTGDDPFPKGQDPFREY